MKKENNKLFTYDQLRELRDSLTVPITEDESNKQDRVFRKYYSICSLFDVCSSTRPLIDALKHHPIAARCFVLKLWNALVELCINVCSTLTTDDIKNDEYKSKCYGLPVTKTESSQYDHVLNDMISEDDYTTIQDEALRFAINTIQEKYNGERKEK